MSMTQVVPTWFKIVGFLLLVGLFYLQTFSNGNHRKEPSCQVVTPAPSIERGLTGKVIVNTKAVATKLFSPVIEPEQAPVVIRESGKQPYYKDDE